MRSRSMKNFLSSFHLTFYLNLDHAQTLDECSQFRDFSKLYFYDQNIKKHIIEFFNKKKKEKVYDLLKNSYLFICFELHIADLN